MVSSMLASAAPMARPLPCACIEMEASSAGLGNSQHAVVVARLAWGKWTRGASHKRLRGGISRGGRVQLRSSMLDTWRDSRDASRLLWHMVRRTTGQQHVPVVVDEIAGQYEDSYEDVDKHLLDYFTYKAVKTVLAQLYEMNPGQYMWFYNFVADNKPQDSKVFIRLLVKERQELGERVMVTRLHLFGKWVKKYNHEKMYNAISDQNLELLRERLIQTVKLPADGDDFQKFPQTNT